MSRAATKTKKPKSKIPSDGRASFELAIDEPAGTGALVVEAIERGYVPVTRLTDNETPAVLRDGTFTTLHRSVIVFVRVETIGELLRKLVAPLLLGWPWSGGSPALAH